MSNAPIVFPRGREVVLGVSAGIAAYKACELLRRLQDHGFLVTVIPTQSALNFVGKATWQALSGRNVYTNVWENSADVSHISVADKADVIVIAPATADLLSRLAQGRADDLLTTTVLAASCPKILVPAMHPQMWLNPATVANVEILRSRGFVVLEPEVGRLTGKDSGIGRFPETATILKEVLNVSQSSDQLLGRRILITAGGTIEPIDPVRYIGNRSSGKQGLAIAYEALRAGAEVTVIAGNTDYFDLEGAGVIKVETASQMKDAVLSELPQHDCLVMSAAVADARPENIASGKIKKDELQSIALLQNEDILTQVKEKKRQNQVVVAFAAETAENFAQLGAEKLQRKGADLLFVNNVSEGRVFGEDATSGLLLKSDLSFESFENVSKFEVAKAIVSSVASRLETVNG